jgi:hypothetical protein
MQLFKPESCNPQLFYVEEEIHEVSGYSVRYDNCYYNAKMIGGIYNSSKGYLFKPDNVVLSEHFVAKIQPADYPETMFFFFESCEKCFNFIKTKIAETDVCSLFEADSRTRKIKKYAEKKL